MDESTFWSIIATSRAETRTSTDPDEDFLDAVVTQLEALEPADIADFQTHVWRCNKAVHTYGISGALYVMTDGKADPVDLEGFRGWLISQGEDVFKKAIDDPDSLAAEDVVPSDAYLPDMLTIAARLYKQHTAEVLTADPAVALGAKPSGKEIAVEDLQAQFPRLCDQFVFSSDEE